MCVSAGERGAGIKRDAPFSRPTPPALVPPTYFDAANTRAQRGQYVGVLIQPLRECQIDRFDRLVEIILVFEPELIEANVAALGE